MNFWQSKAWSPHHLKGTWCSGITPAQHAGGPGFNPQRVHECLPDSISQHGARLVPAGNVWFRKNASAGNRTRVTSMATMHSATRPLMLLLEMNMFTRICINPEVVQMHSSVAVRSPASCKDHEFVQSHSLVATKSQGHVV